MCAPATAQLLSVHHMFAIRDVKVPTRENLHTACTLHKSACVSERPHASHLQSRMQERHGARLAELQRGSRKQGREWDEGSEWRHECANGGARQQAAACMELAPRQT